MKTRRIKTADDRLVYYIRKIDKYGECLRANPEYDRWGWRRYRLLSYRNHVFKLCNRESAESARSITYRTNQR